MVVDDNVRTLRSIGAMLRRRGFETAEYSRSQDCIAALTDELEPVAALVDVILDAGTFGANVVRVLRNTTRRHTPTILMSGWTLDDAPFRLPLRELDAAWMQKPLDDARLELFLANAAASWALPPNSPLNSVVNEVIRRFDLNAQEARIVGQMAAGSTRFELSTDLAISSNTVKSQVKGLLARTQLDNVDQVAALLLRLLSGSASLPDPQPVSMLEDSAKRANACPRLAPA